MDGDNDIFAASQPQPYQILGLRLRPFSLGHYFLLRRLGCGVVSDKSSCLTREDLIVACLVCSMRPKDFQEWIDSGKLGFLGRLKAWLLFFVGKIRKAELLFALSGQKWEYEAARWGRKCGLFDINEKGRLFVEYMDETARMPKYWLEKEPDGGSGTHWAHNVLVTLTGQMGFAEERVMEMSLRESLLHFFRYAESNGVVRLMTEEEISFTEAANG